MIRMLDRNAGDYVHIQATSYLSGRTGEALEKEFDKKLREGKRNFVINFKETEIINSIGISIIVGIIEKIMEQDGSIYVTNLSKVNEEIFRMMGLLQYAPLVREKS